MIPVNKSKVIIKIIYIYNQTKNELKTKNKKPNKTKSYKK